jgi:hypothetical protein
MLEHYTTQHINRTYRHTCILRRAIDIGAVLQHTSHGEYGGGGHLGGAGADGGQQRLGGVIQPLGDVGEALRIGRPHHNHLVHSCALLKVADVLADRVEVLLLVLPGEDVVGAVPLISSDVVRVVDAGQGHHACHVGV